MSVIYEARMLHSHEEEVKATEKLKTYEAEGEAGWQVSLILLFSWKQANTHQLWGANEQKLTCKHVFRHSFFNEKILTLTFCSNFMPSEKKIQPGQE